MLCFSLQLWVDKKAMVKKEIEKGPLYVLVNGWSNDEELPRSSRWEITKNMASASYSLVQTALELDRSSWNSRLSWRSKEVDAASRRDKTCATSDVSTLIVSFYRFTVSKFLSNFPLTLRMIGSPNLYISLRRCAKTSIYIKIISTIQNNIQNNTFQNNKSALYKSANNKNCTSQVYINNKIKKR